VYFQLGQNLHVITTGGTIGAVVYNLIQWAEAHGRVEDLIIGAIQANSSNPALRAFVDDYFPLANDKNRLPINSSRVTHSNSNTVPVIPARNQVFVSYSHSDKRWREEFLKHLRPYIKYSNADVWDDTKLKAGADWQKEIQTALASAKIAVFLVTPSFLASPFIAEEEMPRLLAAAKNEGLIVFWIAVSASAYKQTPIAQYQAANDPAHPLNALTVAQRDREWVAICEKLHAAYSS